MQKKVNRAIYRIYETMSKEIYISLFLKAEQSLVPLVAKLLS